jgi:hypothetical protein
MVTKYNLDLDVADNDGLVPLELYSLAVACFKKAGLIGERRVDLYGRVSQGFDPSCSLIREAKFEIFYGGNIDENFRELIEQWKLAISGFDSYRMKGLHSAEAALELLEKFDPLSSLPVKFLSSMPNITNMELNTPAGIQRLHAHLPNSDFIRFIRPRKDSFLWDYDSLKDFLFDNIFKTKLQEDRTIFQRLIRRYQLRKDQKYLRLYRTLVENPDSIERIVL